jgi:hypothetical protein
MTKQTIRQVLEDLKEIAPGWASELLALETIDNPVEIEIPFGLKVDLHQFSRCIVGEAYKNKKWSLNDTPYNCLDCADYGDKFVDSVYQNRARQWHIDPSEFWSNMLEFLQHFRREHKKGVSP